MRVCQKFCNILRHNLASLDVFCQGCEGDEPCWTMRCQAHLIHSKCNAPDLFLWLGAQPWANLSWPDCWGSCKPSKIFKIICAFTFCSRNVFGYIHRVMAKFILVKYIGLIINGISTIVGYLMPNPFLYNKTVLFQTIQLSINKQFYLTHR